MPVSKVVVIIVFISVSHFYEVSSSILTLLSIISATVVIYLTATAMQVVIVESFASISVVTVISFPAQVLVLLNVIVLIVSFESVSTATTPSIFVAYKDIIFIAVLLLVLFV